MNEITHHDAPALSPDKFALYLQRMDAGQADKMLAFTRILDIVLRDPNTPIAISTGAGSGRLEVELARFYPGAHIIALDYSFPMIEIIQETIQKERGKSVRPPNISVLQASAEYLPIKPDSVMAVLAPSFIHEVASFCDGHRFGPAVSRYTQSVARALKVDGRYAIRDFMAPDQPDEPRILRIGRKLDVGDADPVEFLLKFADQFRGWDDKKGQRDLQKQLQSLKSIGALHEGGKIQLPFKYAMEIAAHYSWALRFDDEIKEKYEYLPRLPYASYVIEEGRKVGVELKLITAESWHQEGYSKHVGGRLDFFHLDGTPSRTPVFTGLIAVERVR